MPPISAIRGGIKGPGGVGRGHLLTQELMRSTAQIPGLPQTLLAILESLRCVLFGKSFYVYFWFVRYDPVNTRN